VSIPDDTFLHIALDANGELLGNFLVAGVIIMARVITVFSAAGSPITITKAPRTLSHHLVELLRHSAILSPITKFCITQQDTLMYDPASGNYIIQYPGHFLYIRGLDGLLRHYDDTELQEGLEPTWSTDGFAVESPGLTGIMNAYFRGYAPILAFPLTFIDTIASYKHQAFDLGWIDNQGIVTSLDAKLDSAKKYLEQGQTIPAINELEAFVIEVEAQKNTHLNSEPYALLKYNAGYLIAELSK
jgi:hypothetical protein